jgi:hypothetical protein
VRGRWFRAAGAGRQFAPAALVGRLLGASGRPLNFTLRTSPLCQQSVRFWFVSLQRFGRARRTDCVTLIGLR